MDRLKLAKEALESGSYDRETIEYIFPELAESEDEKIRKKIIHLVTKSNEYGGYALHKDEAENMIAWLEKQGEKDEEILVLKDQIESLHAAIKAIKETHRIELEKQSEQKSAWSEEDKRNLDWLITVCERIHYKSDPQVSPKGALVLKDWLKSLRSQKKQEWSKEDIEMIEWLIRCCEKEHEELCNNRYGHQEIVSELKRDCRKKWDWLENLKNRIVPQKQWKPSEYEIQLLKDVASGVKDPVAYGASMGVIIGGLEQLKAL